MRKLLSLTLIYLLVAVVLFAASVEKEGKEWLARYADPAEINVNGKWESPDWGKIDLTQAEGARELTGVGDEWAVQGVVSGKSVCLIFSYKQRGWAGGKGKISYTAILAAEGENTLKGGYASGLIKEKGKTKSMVLTRVAAQ